MCSVSSLASFNMALNDFLKSVFSRITGDVSEIQARDAKQYFEEVKKDVLDQVRAHPVSQELENHTNPSAFLSGVRGTLFGFMGFQSGSQPVQALISFLDANLKYTISRRVRGSTKLTIVIPDYADMRSDKTLSLPWDSLAWPEAIEKGISGLGYYLFKRGGNSRSGDGVQLRKELRSANFQTKPFLSVIFKRAETKLNKYR